jgi:hypothetical protein
MIDVMNGILLEAIKLFNKMSPYLLFGFFFAGLLHIFLKVETIAKHFGKRNLLSVVKAAIFGIPLPLCSCGVIPTSLMLYKRGASKGATISFLISTPTSGVDSILATYSLLGPLFALYRVIASGITGICAGVLANLISRNEKIETSYIDECVVCDIDEPHEHTLIEKVKESFLYAFVELLGSIGKWLLIGTLIGGIISYIIPEEFIHNYLGSGCLAMIMMFVISIPIYVCACGAIPIAAALIAKGMSVGAGLVLLLAGPATNTAALMILTRYIGLKTVIVYLGSIALCSIGLGWLLDIIWNYPTITTHMATHGKMLPQTIQIISSILLLLLIGYSCVKPSLKKDKNIKPIESKTIVLNVPQMSCQHCVDAIQNALHKIKEVKSVVVSLKEKIVKIECSYHIPIKKLTEVIERAGYKIKKNKNN